MKTLPGGMPATKWLLLLWKAHLPYTLMFLNHHEKLQAQEIEYVLLVNSVPIISDVLVGVEVG